MTANYRDIDPQCMVLRDHLALDRTVLANERTLLAYVRTALALLAGGGTLLRFFQGDHLIEALGALLLLLGVATAALGLWRFRSVAVRLHRFHRREQG
jgi:putative membrane protein